MNAKQFLAEFGTISSAPDGVQRIRELILQMAVSGRLVQYDRTEDTIEADIHEARRLRIQYSEELKLKNSRTRSTFRQEEIPYPIPVHWRWQRLEQIASYIQRGKGPRYTNSGSIRVVSQKCVRWNGVDLSPARYLDPKALDSYGNERFLQPDDLLWNSTGTGTVGRVAIYRPEQNVTTVADSHVTVVRLSNFVSRYVWCVLASPWVQARIAPEHEDSLVSGTTNQVELSTSSVRGLQIPCPPIEEQQRIVAKVDELMALCDKLEAQQRDRESLRYLVCTAKLQVLKNAEDPSALESAWRKIDLHMNLFLEHEQNILMLMDSLRTLAVCGMLSERTLDHPNIEEIKQSCASLTKQYIREKWIRKQKPIFSANNDTARFPPHWEVVPLNEVGVVIGGVTKGRNLRNRKVQAYPYLRVANVQRGFFDLTEMKYIEIPVEEFSKYQISNGDLLTTEGGDWDKVGRTAIWHGEITDCLHQNHVFKTRVPSENLLNEWVELVINSEIGRNYFAGASK